MLGAKAPTRIHVHSVCVLLPPGGSAEEGGAEQEGKQHRQPDGADADIARSLAAASAARASVSSRKPAKRQKGTTQSSRKISTRYPRMLCNTSISSVLKRVVHEQHQCQSDRHFDGGHRQNEQKHHLPVRLSPARPGDDKRQSGGIQHDLHRKQREDDIPPHQHPDQPEAEKDADDNQAMSWRAIWAMFSSPFPSGTHTVEFLADEQDGQ